MKKKDILIAIIATAFMILGSIEEPIPTEVEEPTEDIIHWKQEEVIETEIVDATIEPLENQTTVESLEKVRFYNVPLSEELQLHIFKECEKHNIAPAIILAMIERESNYKADVIGDNGKSFGLMQIQPKWNQERMNRLGCTDLLDPFQNVTVGIDIVAELKEMNSDIYWVLMAYNGWTEYATKRMESGNISEYALGIVEMASEIERGVENGMD